MAAENLNLFIIITSKYFQQLVVDICHIYAMVYFHRSDHIVTRPCTLRDEFEIVKLLRKNI